MKKLFPLLFLLACVEDTEIRTTQNSVDMEDKSMLTEGCNSDFKWFHDGTTSYTYLVNGHYNGTHWDIILNPQWMASGNGVPNVFITYENVQFKLRIYNGGANTFRYRIDDGTWITLAPNTYGLAFIRTMFGDANCINEIGPLLLGLDVERLTCGSSPHTMQMDIRIISISNGHNFGTPGVAINQPIISAIWLGNPGCVI